MLFGATVYLENILELTPKMADELGIRGIILDVDNTLTTHDNPTPIDGIYDWIDAMKSSGVKLIIVSNNTPERVSPFAKMLGIEFTADGKKPLSNGFKVALQRLELPKTEVCAVGDQIFTDILGANLFKIKSVHVKPIELEKTVFFKFKRFMEKPFLRGK